MTEVSLFASCGGAPIRVHCTWDQRPDHTWTVKLHGPFGESAAVADDAFEALRRARETPESEGWLFGLNGARADVWPSGMARDAGGTRAYILDPAKISAHEALELVDVFAPADLTGVATVETQLANARRQLGSSVQ